MKILQKQFYGKLHSWSNCGWGITEALGVLGHKVDVFSTDAVQYTPKYLLNRVIGYVEENKFEVHGRNPDSDYDCQISYTAMKNFQYNLSHGTKNRFGIWCYEWAGKNALPTGFAKHYKYCDKIFAPSKFAKQIFVDSGVPAEHVDVISHGVDVSYLGAGTVELPTDKNFKLLANIAQNHKRKNIKGLLEAYGKAFTSKDDVCLILKAKDKPVSSSFEVSLSACLKEFNQKFPNHAEVKIFSDFLPDVSSLYRSVDATVTLAHCEGFYFPGLESIISGKLAIAPNWGGQLDFLNESNSLLINGKEERADPTSMYWEPKPNTIWFKPSTDDAAEKLRFARDNYLEINKKLESNRMQSYKEYCWKNIVSQMLERCV